MKRPVTLGFLVPALAASAAAQTLVSLPAPRSLPALIAPLSSARPLPTLTPAGASILPVIRMDAAQELPRTIRALIHLPKRLEEPQRAVPAPVPAREPSLEELFDGRKPRIRPGVRIGLPEEELEREIGLGR